MSDIAVIYKSKYGSTKKYANWIADELKADIYDASKVKINELQKYSTIIYGGGMYMESIKGISLITRNFDNLKDKNLIVFSVGLEDPKESRDFQPTLNKAFTDEMQKVIKAFQFRGAIDHKKLTFAHRFSMGIFIRILKKMPEEKINDGIRMILDIYGKSVDYTDKEIIKPPSTLV